jgi:ParB/RepB/Spo0J family partition protein
MAKKKFTLMDAEDFKVPTISDTEIADAIIEDNNREHAEVPLDRLLPNPRQPRKRFVEEDIRDLADDIAEHGLLQDILVRRRDDGKWYELVCGDRRSRACRLLGWTTIPAQIRQVTDAEMLRIAVAENDQREALTPFERAEAYYQLGQELNKELGKRESEEIPVRLLAEKVRKHKDHVQLHLNLRRAPKTLQSWVEEDPNISLRIIDELRKVPDEAIQQELMLDVKRKLYNQDEIIAIVRNYRQLKSQQAAMVQQNPPRKEPLPQVWDRTNGQDVLAAPTPRMATSLQSPSAGAKATSDTEAPFPSSDPALRLAKLQQELAKDDRQLNKMLGKYRTWQGEEKRLFSQYAEGWLQSIQQILD